MRVSRRPRFAFAVAAIVLAAAACDDAQFLEPEPPGSSLTISNASPSSGNASLTSAAHELAGNQVRLTQTVSGVTHEIDVVWDEASGDVTTVKHTWTTATTTAGDTECGNTGAPSCNPGEIELDVTARTVTFTDLDLAGTFILVPTSRSTLDGTMAW